MAQDSQENRLVVKDSTDHNTGQSLGGYLQRERLKKQLSLEEVAAQTCINIGTLRAIEDNDRSKMPAEVFTRGFIKLYARCLGLEPQEALDRYGREIGRVDEENIRNHDVFQNEKMAESSVFFDLRILFFLVVGLIIVVICLYFFLYSEPPAPRQSSSSSGTGGNSLSSQINQKFQSVESPSQSPHFSSPSPGDTYSSPVPPSENKPPENHSPAIAQGTGDVVPPGNDQSLPQTASPLSGDPATPLSPTTSDKQEGPSPVR